MAEAPKFQRGDFVRIRHGAFNRPDVAEVWKEREGRRGVVMAETPRGYELHLDGDPSHMIIEVLPQRIERATHDADVSAAKHQMIEDAVAVESAHAEQHVCSNGREHVPGRDLPCVESRTAHWLLRLLGVR